MKKYSKEDIIERFRERHCDRYDYSLFEYGGMHKKGTIICREHGIFAQTPHSHLKGQGCPKCGIESRIEKRKDTTESFIEKAKKVHGDIYDYSNIKYVSSQENVEIICPKHGIFHQMPNVHLCGGGCPSCYNEKRHLLGKKEKSVFIDEMQKIYGNKYDFSNYEYINARTRSAVECPKHGVFYRTPTELLNKRECQLCMKERRAVNTLERNTKNFIEKATQVHNGRYSYDNVAYVNSVTPVEIICPIHGSFYQKPTYHLCGNGCQKCANEMISSNGEMEICRFLMENKVEYSQNDRKALKGNELDVFIPSQNIAIEYDGLYWHNEKNKTMNYHISKTKECNKIGIRLIHIFEDEWIYKKEIVKSKILNILGKTNRMIFARKCDIKEVSYNDAKKFLIENHLQGNCLSKYRFGLYFNNELVSIMTFGKKRINLGSSNKEENEYEMLRFCNKLNASVIGGASKLLKHFIRHMRPKSIVSYADMRWSEGKMYEKLGFTHLRDSKPSYFYVIGNKRHNRFSYRKDVLIRDGFDKNKTEHEIMLERGIYRIYDCGSKVYQLNISQ